MMSLPKAETHKGLLKGRGLRARASMSAGSAAISDISLRMMTLTKRLLSRDLGRNGEFGRGYGHMSLPSMYETSLQQYMTVICHNYGCCANNSS